MKIHSLCVSIIAVLAAAVFLPGCGNGGGGGGRNAGPSSPAGVISTPARGQALTPPPAGVPAKPVSDQVPTPPAAPAGVTAMPAGDQIIISWSEVAGATSYNIYWSLTAGVTTTNGTAIAVVTGPYTHTSLAVETTYYYIITALNASGESAASSPVSATTFNPAQTNFSLRYRRAMKQY
jgi:hypothetical protein